MLDYKCPNCGRLLGYKGLCWQCQSEEERKEVFEMTPEQRREKMAHLIANIDKISDLNEEYNDFWKLLSCLGVCPPELQRAALQKEVFYPPVLYYHAPKDVRDTLIRLLNETDKSMTASHLMECIAMQGDDVSLKALLALEKNPREWREALYVDPSVYAQCGGWTFNKEGERRDLNYNMCYPMVKKSENKKPVIKETGKTGKKMLPEAAVIGRARRDKCSNCGCIMMDMLVLDGRDERLEFLGIDGIITASCCPSCVCFTESSFSKFELDGSSTPLKDTLIIQNVENYCEEEDIKELSDNLWELGKTPVPVFYGAYYEDVNTIGGFANWIQDWNYVSCPECEKPMMLLAQIQWETVQLNCEGTLYIEICPECRIASMHHQQT